MRLTEEEIEFLKESNAIEGEYSEQALRDAKRAWMMAKLAWEYNKFPSISIDYILGIHSRLMKNLNKEIAGRLRKERVGIMTKEGFKEAISPSEVKSELGLLCNGGIWPWYTSEEQVKQWHIQFEHIHPFEDGNGRTGRILMNIQRLCLKLPLLIIHEGKEQQEYYKWFQEKK